MLGDLVVAPFWSAVSVCHLSLFRTAAGLRLRNLNCVTIIQKACYLLDILNTVI